MAYSGTYTGVIEQNWERPTFNKQLNKTTMNKSKFKSVKFLPFDKGMARYFAQDG